jgi:hypothetical protein
MPVLEFNPQNHTYGIDGVLIPSVTTILQDMGLIDTRYFTDYGRDRGKLVHRIIHWHITYELDEDTIDPTLRPYFDAWLSFEKDTNFICTAAEKPLFRLVYRFAGTPDYIGLLNGIEAVIDGKSGGLYPSTALQLVGYEILAERPLKRYALQLMETGKYKLTPYKERSDRGVFLGCLAAYHWKQKNMKG